MTFLWSDGTAITVVIDAGVPQQFIWQRNTHIVQGIAHRWRVDEDWWRGRICRDYYKLYTDSGYLVVIFQDLLTRQWYLERLYD